MSTRNWKALCNTKTFDALQSRPDALEAIARKAAGLELSDVERYNEGYFVPVDEPAGRYGGVVIGRHIPFIPDGKVLVFDAKAMMTNSPLVVDLD